MGKKLYVGNLTYNVNESDFETLFFRSALSKAHRSSSIGPPTDPRGSDSWRWDPTPKRRRRFRHSMTMTMTGGG